MSTLPADPRPANARPRVLDDSRSERTRPFGSDFAPQNPAYLIYIPVLLAIVGLAVWILPNAAMFVVGALVGSLVGLYALADIVFREAPLRLTTIYGMTVLLGYDLGAINTWLTVDRGSLSLAELFARDPATLSRGIAATLAAATVLFVVGELYERPIFGREFRLRFGPNTFLVVLFTTLLILGAYVSGKVGYMGLAADESGHVNPVTALIVWWFFPSFAYSVCASINTKGVTRIGVSILTGVQLLALVPFGRGIFAFALLLALLAARLGERRFVMPMYKRLIVGTIGVAIVLVASVVFLYLRVAGYGHKGKLSIADRLDQAYELVSKRNPLEVLELLGTNASKRTFMIGFFSDLLEASQHSSPLYGRDILYNLQLNVPSIISRDKFGITPYDEELLVDMHWGFSYQDEANSLLTAGVTDFGFVGLILYPLLILGMLRVVLEGIQLAVPTHLAVIVALAYIVETLHAENVPAGFFLEVRTTFMIVVIYYVFSRLPTFRFKHPE